MPIMYCYMKTRPGRRWTRPSYCWVLTCYKINYLLHGENGSFFFKIFWVERVSSCTCSCSHECIYVCAVCNGGLEGFVGHYIRRQQGPRSLCGDNFHGRHHPSGEEGADLHSRCHPPRQVVRSPGSVYPQGLRHDGTPHLLEVVTRVKTLPANLI